MKIITLTLKEIKQQFRDKQGLILMTLFPLVLTLVLGFALSNMFSEDMSPSTLSCLYTTDDSMLSQAFREGFVPYGEEAHLTLTEEVDSEKAKQRVEDGETDGFIQISGGKITVITREGKGFNASLIQTILKGFAERYDAMVTLAQANPSALQEVSKVDVNTMSFTREVSLSRNKAPRAMDYYAITMLTLIIMYAGSAGISTIVEEKRNKTLYRMFASPLKNHEILISKAIGLVITTLLQALFVFLFGKLFLGADWGTDFASVLMVIIAEIIMMVSVGIGCGYLFKSSDTGFAFMQTIIPILVFLGGGYVNLELLGVGGIVSTLAYLSPIKWINKTLLSIIYANDYSSMATTLAICLGIAVVFLSVSAILSKKELKV